MSIRNPDKVDAVSTLQRLWQKPPWVQEPAYIHQHPIRTESTLVVNTPGHVHLFSIREDRLVCETLLSADDAEQLAGRASSISPTKPGGGERHDRTK